MDLNKELIYIPVADEDVLVGVSEWAGDLGDDWDLIFLPNGIVTKNNPADIDRVNKLIKQATD